ncbi:hypothetical protein GHT06_016047 [Daphnia sinensis]|uniref:Uncharacterized protein n=1 Tax=Daphnia sinensis TaxID=1820382 RepID=A0AAD5PV80_9CRUS|nr:hypothetical protein GHT06_016047 [Daphnia sinensis]
MPAPPGLPPSVINYHVKGHTIKTYEIKNVRYNEKNIFKMRLHNPITVTSPQLGEDLSNRNRLRKNSSAYI